MRPRRIGWALLGAVALLCTARSVRAAEPPLEKLIHAGVTCYDQLDYGCAIGKLREALRLMTAKGLEPAPREKITLYQTLAFALAAVSRHGEAIAMFEKVLALQPTFVLDPELVGPRVYADYRKARERVLMRKLALKPPPVALPPLVAPPEPTADWLLLVPPPKSALQDSESGPHKVGFALGAAFLFGDDAERYSAGFGAGLEYSYDIGRFLQVAANVLFFNHEYQRGDLLAGQSSTLFVLNPTVGLRARIELARWVGLGLGATAGVSVMGVGNLSDRVGGTLGATVSVDFRPVPQFAVDLLLIPMVTIASDDAGQLGTSFSLPLMLRVAIGF